MSDKFWSFSYVGFPNKDDKGEIVGEIFRPLVPIKLAYGHKLSRTFDALADSGSDRNLFPAELGELIGISFKKRKNFIITGIGGVQIKAFRVKIGIYLGTKRYPAEADFSYQQRDLLIGREGFFSLFKKIVFREQDKFIDIYI